MPNVLLPTARARSATAVPGKSDLRDENIYSALVLAHGGSGKAKLFTTPQGSPIPELKGSGITATANAHQTTYTDLTTNLEKAGELGSALGDAGIRAVGITFEQAAFTTAFNSTPGLAQRGFGATPFECADIASKCTVEMKVGGKRQNIGPVIFYPQLGAIGGSISVSSNTTAAAALGYAVGIVNNGALPLGRKLKWPIMVARDDVFLVEFAIGGSATLAFSNAATDGQPTLVWCNNFASVKGDVR